MSAAVRESLTAKVLGLLLPNRAKRLILISSFIAHIQNNDHPDKELLSKINKLLKLCNSDGALLAPMVLHAKVWDNETILESLAQKNFRVSDLSEIASFNLTNTQIRTLSEQIVALTPSWLIYGSKTRIKHDLTHVFGNLNALMRTQ